MNISVKEFDKVKAEIEALPTPELVAAVRNGHAFIWRSYNMAGYGVSHSLGEPKPPPDPPAFANIIHAFAVGELMRRMAETVFPDTQGKTDTPPQLQSLGFLRNIS